MRIVWMNVNDCVFIPHNHISSHDGLQFLLTEIERQLVKAPLAAAIGTYLISLTVPTEPCMKCGMKHEIDHHTGKYVPYSFR